MKKINFTTEPHTLKSSYVADLMRVVELFYFNDKNSTVYSSHSPHARQMGKLLDFRHNLLVEKCDYQKGYYYVNHVTRMGGYLGDDFLTALKILEKIGFVENIQLTVDVVNKIKNRENN